MSQFVIPLPEDYEEQGPVQPAYINREEEISQAVERYLSNSSPATVKGYKADMQTWYSFSHKNIEQTTEDDVLRYIKYLETRNYAPSSINRKLASLSKVISILIRLGVLQANPVQTLSATTRIYKPVSTHVQDVITRHDVEAVIANARPRTSIPVRLMATTGMRVSEMLNIKKADIEAYDSSFLRIKLLGKRSKIRFVFIGYDLYKDIKETFDTDSIYLLSSKSGNKLSRTNLYRQIRTAFSRHAHKDYVGNHALRHWFATESIVKQKKDIKSVSQYLGHVSVKTTLDQYTHGSLSPEEAQLI
jgi:site-specific recombinase XerD